MFGFLLKYELMSTIRQKDVIFWLLAFPFFLTTIFGIVMQNIGIEDIKTIPIAVDNAMYEKVMKEISYEEKPMFKIVKTDNPNKDLKEGKIKGYVYAKDMISEPVVKVKEKSITSTVIYSAVNYIYHSVITTGDLMLNPENHSKINEIIKYVSSKEIGMESGYNADGKSAVANYFYALLAMICMGAMTYGVTLVSKVDGRGDMAFAKRIIIAPIARMKIILSSFIVYLSFSFIVSIIMYIYMRKVFLIEFGGTPAHIILALFIGNLFSIGIGTFISLVLKAGTETKYKICAAFYVFSSFLAGMMTPSIPALITNNIPALNYINPGTLISRLFSSLYLYDDHSVFWRGIVNILIFMTILTFLMLGISRRRSNESV